MRILLDAPNLISIFGNNAYFTAIRALTEPYCSISSSNLFLGVFLFQIGLIF